MWGNLRTARTRPRGRGPIPAHAGQPWRWPTWWPSHRAYPRACGATSDDDPFPQDAAGLSPRMRGNRHPSAGRRRGGGPIPAHAGQPSPMAGRSRGGGAYPRACGATCPPPARSRNGRGPSPRMRGNPHDAREGARHGGPIPAHAGQPARRTQPSPTTRAYPRACGATEGMCRSASAQYGLSPRMRGNHPAVSDRLARQGPIPAHAGQPRANRDGVRSLGAYPRACGATGPVSWADPSAWGLSPRMRGNRNVSKVLTCAAGPIPAHAGQPVRWRPLVRRRRAYPRACGATRTRPWISASLPGLSPRMRGNRAPELGLDAADGPIPAHAGQPTGR